MSSVGLRCPLCGSWYSNNKEMYPFWEINEECGNRSGEGFDPLQCCNDHPCPGKLIVDTPELAAKFRKPKGY